MKIISMLRLNTLISLGVIILIIFSLLWSFREAYQANRNVIFIDEIKKTAFERIILRDDWLLNRQDRAKTQWYAKTEILRQRLESVSQRLTGKDPMAILQKARKDFEITASSFSEILSKHTLKDKAKKDNLSFTESEARQISQIFLKAYSLNDNIDRLRNYYERAYSKAFDRSVYLIIFFIMVGIAAIIINSSVINRIMAKRVKALDEGITIIGGGNLEYKIEAAGYRAENSSFGKSREKSLQGFTRRNASQ